MITDPAPLAAGSVLGDRFAVQRMLGRGGFGIAYLARDETRGDLAVVKELAPVGIKRSKEGLLDLDQSGTSGHLLRHRFLQEAETLRRLHHDGIPALRAAFAENGTAYHVTSYVPHGRTLEEKLRRDGPLGEAEARDVFTSLLDILEVVHAAGVLHRDVKPSNVLLGPDGQVVLLDFGAAREWAQGGSSTHTVMHTPGYAPPEQLSERAARGAATDLYALCATVYHSLAGKPPPTAPDRISGIPLIPIRTLRPDIDPALGLAIEAGLAIRLADRPESVEVMRARLAHSEGTTVEQTVQRMDEALVRLRQFRFDRRACPACDGTLQEPRPLRRLGCPVCRDGMVRPRDLDDRLCPECRTDHVIDVDNTQPIAVCPECGKGMLAFRRKSLLATARIAECPACRVHVEADGDRLTCGDETLTGDEWRLRSGRSRQIKRCPVCDAQFDLQADGRWRQAKPEESKRGRLYWDEWTRVAAGLEPGAGNAVCDACRADFWREGESLTLLDAPRDPYGFAGRFVGRPLAIEDVRWLGAGKASGAAGLLCDACGTEFDRAGALLRLVASPNRRLARHAEDELTLEDWHRIAEDLPIREAERAYEAQLEPLLLEAYLRGEIAFDAGGALWRGRATRLTDESDGILAISPTEFSFGGRFRRWRVPLADLIQVEVNEDVLMLSLRGEAHPVEFEVLPLVLTAHLKSGERSIELTVDDLAERLTTAIEAEA